LGVIPPGTTVGRYRIETMVGSGGTGTVYRADDVETGATVALKVLHPEAAENPILVRRAWREARAAMAVDHPGIVHILDTFEHDGAPVLVMEYIAGESLEEMLERRVLLPLGELAPIMLQVASSLGTAHSLGIVHRDLKPENILLGTNEHGLITKLLDFGVAKLTAGDGSLVESLALTNQGMLMGTPYYMSPEQARGREDIDARADIWAFGVIMYRALTGILPTYGEAFADVFRKVLADPIPHVGSQCPGLPPDVGEMVMRMLARPPEERPQDLREVYILLARYAG
jgi:serine/threonine-protein kinase